MNQQTQLTISRVSSLNSAMISQYTYSGNHCINLHIFFRKVQTVAIYTLLYSHKISLSSLVAKALNRMILNRLKPIIETILRRNQNGFRPGRSTAQQISVLRRLIVQSVMHINLHFFRRIFPEAQAFIKVLVTQFHSEAAVLAWA